MQMTREQEETEAAAAAETDASAMDKLMQETLDEAALPETEAPPPDIKPTPPDTGPPPPETAPKKTETEPPPPDIKAKDTPAELDDWEKQIESHQLPAGATRQAKDIIKAVRQAARDEHRLFRDERVVKEGLQRENAELKSKLAQAAKDREELDQFRPIVETLAIEQNPNLSTPYVNRIAHLDRQILDNLCAAGLPVETAKFIMQNGGPSRFSRDSTSQMEAEREDGQKGEVTMSHQDFWEERVLKNLSDENKDKLRLAFDDQTRVREARDAAMRHALGNREQYFKDMEAQSKVEQEKFKVEINKELQRQVQGLGDIVNEQKIPENATPAERESIEEHNAAIREARSNFEKFFLDTSYQALVTKSLGGLLLKHMTKLLGQKDAKIAAADARFDEVNKKWQASLKSANTSHRQSVQQQAAPVKGLEYERNDGLRMEKMMQELPG